MNATSVIQPIPVLKSQFSVDYALRRKSSVLFRVLLNLERLIQRVWYFIVHIWVVRRSSLHFNRVSSILFCRSTMTYALVTYKQILQCHQLFKIRTFFAQSKLATKSLEHHVIPVRAMPMLLQRPHQGLVRCYLRRPVRFHRISESSTS